MCTQAELGCLRLAGLRMWVVGDKPYDSAQRVVHRLEMPRGEAFEHYRVKGVVVGLPDCSVPWNDD